MMSARGRQRTCPHRRRWESYVATLSLTEPAERAAVQAAQHRLQHAMRQRGEAELDLFLVATCCTVAFGMGSMRGAAV